MEICLNKQRFSPPLIFFSPPFSKIIINGLGSVLKGLILKVFKMLAQAQSFYVSRLSMMCVLYASEEAYARSVCFMSLNT